MDILSIVSNVQQVSPEELEASQQKTNSSARLNNVIHIQYLYLLTSISAYTYYFPIIIVILI